MRFGRHEVVHATLLLSAAGVLVETARRHLFDGDPAALRHWPQGARVKVNYGSAEEILSTRPDLILTDPFMAPSMRQVLEKTGARIVGAYTGTVKWEIPD